MHRLRRLAEATPPTRERVIDLLRAVAITAVVLGHWLVSAVGYDAAGRLTARSALAELPWAHFLTWIAQVMPLFFLVGGYANAASLTSHRARGGDAAGWLRNRGTRLTRPTTALVLVLAGAAFTAQSLGADPGLVRLAVWFACIPLWFLSVYLAVVILAPMMYALHRRFGFAVPAVLVGLVAVGDIARLYGDEAWGYGNFLFGWLAIHQMGFAWRDRRLSGRPRVAVPVVLGGLGLLLLLTLAGPYPVSMINVPGERLHNMSPPSLALLAVATVQLGLALLLRERAERRLHRPRPWTVVVTLNSVILTIFLWHISAAIVVTAALHALGVLPAPEVDTAAWWAWRIPWVLLLSVALAGLVAIFGRIEMRRSQLPPQRFRFAVSSRLRLFVIVAAFLAVAVGLVYNNVWPANSPTRFGLPTTALVAYLSGVGVLWLLARFVQNRD
ncbi:acyltransferase family protein [Allorhizocola rhizosphaerae]|uniref:acyltransferase family protein n=1 Tax=Allorhizocola rhizosphaerae TaxID=1872709 RepID=UPI000E3D2F3D|nr:acyltransferase [Allorhizocola rhizosphaerae]